MAGKVPERSTGSRARIFAISTVVWCAVFVAGWASATFMPGHIPHTLLVVAGSIVVATLISGLAGAVVWLRWQRQRIEAQRADEILHLNHHIRNAMQVIAYSQNGLPADQLQAVLESLNRIGEALRSVSGKSNAVSVTQRSTANDVISPWK